MLGLIKAELNRRNIDFEYLDGQSTTVQRERSVNNFQENEDLRVFLISLKAGGTGLNLTGCRTMFILSIPGGTRQWKTRPSTVVTVSGRTKKCLPTV